MERQIVFRGKRKDNGKWIHGDLQLGDGDHIPMIGEVCGGHDPIYYQVEEETIGQLTGVNDKDRIMIFEGDVLEADYKYDRLGYNGGVDPDNDCICYGVVEFDNDALQWVLNIYKAEYPISKQIEEDKCTLFPLHIFGHEYGYDNCNLKIIGNRFDNPELISKNK